MVIEEFASSLAEICSRSPIAPGRPLLWTIIANPKAGGFTIKSRWKKHRAYLEECARAAKVNPVRENSSPSQTVIRESGPYARAGLALTGARGEAGKITGALIDEAAAAAQDATGNIAARLARPFFLIITAGGDGTSLEVMTSLYHAPEEIRRDFVVLRLPMGTGNDGACAADLGKALDLIISPAEVTRQRALRLIPSGGKGPFLAFNILSAGLDAFVTHMTNKMKGRLPGDSYKLWVDIAALFYDRIFKVDVMDVRARDSAGNEVRAFREKLLLLAVGVSGRRSYGSRKWILPDDRNVCAIKQTRLYRKFVLKTAMSSGTHVREPEAILWNAQTVEFTARHPILAQMDGETVRLSEGDFPAVIELSGPVIPVLKKIAERQVPNISL